MATTSFEIPRDPALQHQDAVVMLVADHEQVKALFTQFQQLKHGGDAVHKAAVVKQICELLTIHVQLEEELFYPTVRQALSQARKDTELVAVAMVEQAGAKELVAQLADATPDEELYDAKVTVLGEQIAHHVQEEETLMFPQAQAAGVDTAALGVKMLLRRSALLEKMGLADYDSPLS